MGGTTQCCAMSSADAAACTSAARLTTLVSVDVRVAGCAAEFLVEARDTANPAPIEAVDDAPFSYGFTGRHDGGALPPTRGGYYAHLLDAVAAAKAAVAARSVPAAAAGREPKRARDDVVDEADEATEPG